VAVILFFGGVAANLVASDLDRIIGRYGRWAVWIVFVIALVVTVIVAIVDALDGKVKLGTPNVDDQNALGDEIGGDYVARDKNIYINQRASPIINALHQLRTPVGDFVGREQEIESLINALRHGSRACITGISGMGGIGKTELALFVAERLMDDYPDAQFFINLQGSDASPRAPQEIMGTCIRAFLGPEAKLPDDWDQLSQLYRSQLSGKRTLLLLDNAADTAQVQPLLPPSGCAVLVTSRQAVTLPGMTRLTLNPLTNKEARKLLLEIAPHAEGAAEEISALCGHLPLAIRAAGSLLATAPDLDPIDYATQLQDERNRLERIGKEGVEIGVAASFNLSYERLTPETARVFRLLSVFSGTFDAAAGEAVCVDAEHPKLSDLVRRSLVLYDPNTRRYRLHDLTRLFVNSKVDAQERAVASKRHATYFRDVLTSVNELYKEGGEALARGLALFDLEWGNIQTGYTWVAAQGIEADEEMAHLRMTYPDAGSYVLNLRLLAREWIHWLEVALAAARRLKNRNYEGAMLGNLGIAYRSVGENKRAIQFHEQRLTIAREIGDRRGEGNALCNLGVAYFGLDETQRAIEFYEQYLVITRKIEDRRGEGMALGNLGVAYFRLGETQRAIQFYEQYLTITREIGDRRGEGMALGNLGNAYWRLDENERAIDFHKQYLAIAREIGDRKGESIALWNLSLTLDHLGKRAQAIQYTEQSLRIKEQIEDPDVAKVRAKLAQWREGSSHN
jgi:tetratricopeptide (TPR) repeat protein